MKLQRLSQSQSPNRHSTSNPDAEAFQGFVGKEGRRDWNAGVTIIATGITYSNEPSAKLLLPLSLSPLKARSCKDLWDTGSANHVGNGKGFGSTVTTV